MKLYNKILAGIMITTSMSSMVFADRVNIAGTTGIDGSFSFNSGDYLYLPNDRTYQYHPSDNTPIVTFSGDVTNVTLDIQSTLSYALRYGQGGFDAGDGILYPVKIAPGTDSTTRSKMYNNGGWEFVYASSTSGDGIVSLTMNDYSDGINYATGNISAKTSGSGGAVAVLLDGTDITFNNMGTLSASLYNSTTTALTAVKGVGSNIVLTNSGTLQAIGGSSNKAVDFSGASDSTFNYYSSGKVKGSIVFGTNNTLNLYSGGEESVDQTLIISGTTPTIAAPNGDLVFVTSVVNTGTEVNITSVAPHSTPHVPANNSSSNVHAAIVNRAVSRELSVSGFNNNINNNMSDFNMWMSTYGEDKWRPKDGNVHRVHTQFGGFVFGADKAVMDNTSAGFFVGGLTSKMDIGLNDNVKIKSNGVVLGGYAHTHMDKALFTGILEFGYIDHKRDRAVYESNLDENTGKTTIKGKNHEFFVSPSLSVARLIQLGDSSLTPSLTVRYTGQKISTLDEGTGVNNHKVKSRFVSSAATRTQLTMSRKLNEASVFNVYGGLEYTKLLSDKVELENLGSGNQSQTVKVKKIADTDLLLGMKVNHKFNKAVGYIGLEGTKGLKKGDEGENYSVALSIGADF